MMGIDLTTGQKVQIAFVSAALLVAGYLVYRSTRPAPDLTIASWVEPVREGQNPSIPIAPNNPADPSKTATMTVFACYDGRLEIIEYPRSSETNATFQFEADYRRAQFNMFQDPLTTIESIGDPYQRVLSFAAYSATIHRPQGLLGKVGLTADQLKEEKVAREAMMNAITLINNSAQTNLLQPTLYKSVLDALREFRKVPGDPTKDAPKAVAAHKVVELAMKYIATLQEQRNAAAMKYVAAVDAMLQRDQKDKLAKLASSLRIRPRPGAGRAVRVATAALAG